MYGYETRAVGTCKLLQRFNKPDDKLGTSLAYEMRVRNIRAESQFPPL